MIDPLDSRSAPSPDAQLAQSQLPHLTTLGTRLGRYSLTEVLGHGAMASVFRAHDSQLGRDVAVKVMNMTIAARGEGAERFRREALAVAALKHPGIVEIYDFVAATADEPSYIVAELIEGPTLRRMLDERQARLLPEVAALIALPLAEALATAHARGIVHRDVKPDNVMLEHGAERSRVVITDFGVAHITGLETMTASGALVGSPAYMSPEQARAHEMGPGTDIWAIGVLLYEMATGCLPFPGKDPFVVISSITAGSFRRPSQIAATVGLRFERIVLRCLKPNPAERYPSACELAADLRALVEEAGLLPEQAALRRFLEDPAKLEAELRPKIADAAVAEARRRARRGELARALAEIGRATAYVPTHAGADALLKKLSAGRAMLRAMGVIFAGLMLAGAAWVVWHPPWRRTTDTTAPALSRPGTARLQAIAPAAEAPTPAVAPSAGPNAPTPTAAPVNPPSASRLPPAHAESSSVEKPKTSRRARPVAAIRPSQARQPGASAAQSEASPAPEPAPAPAEPSAPVRPSPGVVHLFATGAICYPSLDEEPASVFMPRYENVAAGRHKIFCARNKDGDKELVGEIDLPPGAKIERTVTQKDGKLVLARPR